MTRRSAGFHIVEECGRPGRAVAYHPTRGSLPAAVPIRPVLLHPDTARNRLTGIAIVSAAYLCFTVLDTSAKWLVRSLPVLEVVWLRFATHLLLLSIPVIRAGGLSPGRVRRPGLQAIRALLMVTMTGLNFWALQTLQLSETSAVMFAMPILAALLSVWWLGERLDAGRWIAVFAGFAGVLIIVQPGSAAFQPAILLSVGNTIAYALFSLLTRRLAATDPPEITNLLTALGAVVLVGPFAFAHWQAPPSALHWGLIGLTGLAGGVGHLLIAIGHRFAPASTLAPFLYPYILYMSLAGWLVFGDVPRGTVLAGAAVVIASGLYLIWREREPTRAPRAPTA